MPMAQDQQREYAQDGIDGAHDESDNSQSKEWETLRPLTEVYTHSEDEDGEWRWGPIGRSPHSGQSHYSPAVSTLPGDLSNHDQSSILGDELHRASSVSAYATPVRRMTPPLSEPSHHITIYHPSVAGSDYSDSEEDSSTDDGTHSRLYPPSNTAKTRRSPPRTEHSQPRPEGQLPSIEVAQPNKPASVSDYMTGRSHDGRYSRLRRLIDLNTPKKGRPIPRRKTWDKAEPPTPNPAGQGKQATVPVTDPMAEIWPLYLEHALAEDKETVQTWNTDLDSILIFAALFSAVLTTFIIESYKGLQADPTAVLLQAILFELQTSRNASTAAPPGSSRFQAPRSAIRVNVYWFSSLILSLTTALVAILAKQWVNYLLAGLSSVPSTRARHRQYRIDGMNKWRLPALLSFLPILLHIALLLFFAGLVDFVWDLNASVATVSALWVCATAALYVSANVLAYIYPDCPFKTSMTVFLSVVVDLLVYAYGEMRLAVDGLGRAVQTIGVRVAQMWRFCLTRGMASRSVEDGLPNLQRSNTLIETKARRKYETLRISSLRSQDEKFIAENQPTMDARVLIWLTQNSDRLHKAEQLSDAIVRFPHLQSHRQLFIQQGSFAFLERSLLTRWSPAIYTFAHSQVSMDRQLAVTSILHALAILESEVGVDDVVARKTSLDMDDQLVSSKRSPFLLVEASANPTGSLLSPSSFPIITSILQNATRLPLSVVASVLRLSVRVPQTEQLQPLAVRSIVHSFLQRVAIFRLAPDEHCDAAHAVNTVIYLALHDVSYPQRDGFVVPVMGGKAYWLDILSKIVARSRVSSSARRQLAWAICALGFVQDPNNGTHNSNVVVKPRIPRFDHIGPFADQLTGLISGDTPPDILCAVLATMECILWKQTADEARDSADACRLLQPLLLGFLAELMRGLQPGSSTSSPPLAAKIAVSVTRIAVYLALFHCSPGSDMRRALVGATLALLRALANSRDPASLSTTVYAIRSHPSRMEVVKLHGNHVLWWIYRASSRIVSLFYDTRSPKSVADRPNANPFELVFVTNTQSDVGSALTRAVRALVELSLSGPPDPVIQSNFSAIMRHAFGQGRQPHDGTRGPPEPGDFGIVDYFVASGGLAALPLNSSLDATLRRDILEPALKYLAMALYESRPQSVEEERMIAAPTSNHGFRAKRLLLELRSQCQKFLRRLEEGLIQKTYLPCTVPRANSEPLLHAIRIHGYLAHHCTRLSATRDPSSGIAMLQFLSPLVAEDIMDLVPDVAVRRHAWGSIGSFVSLYATPIGRLCEERDLERFFHFEDFNAETIAVGLIRALRLVDIENDVFRKSHCKHCCLKPHEFFQLLLHLTGSSQADYWTVFGGVVTMALRAIVGLWDKNDQEALQVKRSLFRHDFVSHLPACLTLQGEPGEIAQALQAKLDRTPEHEVVEIKAVPETDVAPQTDHLLGTMGEWVHSLLVSRVLG